MLWVVGYQLFLKVNGFEELTTANQQPTTNNQQPTTNNQQPTTNNQQLLHTIYVTPSFAASVLGNTSFASSSNKEVLSNFAEK